VFPVRAPLLATVLGQRRCWPAWLIELAPREKRYRDRDHRNVRLLNEHAWRLLQSEERGYATGLNLKSRSGLSISSLRRIAGSGA
jgi:hypothetical protein